MNPPSFATLALTFSLVGNIALGLAFLRQPSPASGIANPQITSLSAKLTANSHAPSDNASQSPAKKHTGQLWDALNHSDPATLIANLRKAGFTSKQIRSIVRNLVYEKYSSRMMEARGYTRDKPYWKANESYYYDSKEGRAVQRLYREAERETRTLLGSDYFAGDDESLPYLQRQYGNIPADKIIKLTAIQQDYEDMSADLQFSGPVLPADREKLKLIQKEQQADIEKILTAEELFEYDLRNSPASWRLRGYNQTLDLTETEYRSLFPLYQNLEKQFPSDSEEGGGKARKAAEDKMQDQIKAILGDARYAEYKQSQDQSAQQENRLVVRLGFPLTTATQLVDAKKEFRDQVRKVSGKNDLTEEQKKEQLSTLLQAAESRITGLIGERGLSIYRDYGGSWLKAPSEVAPKKTSP